MDTLSLINRLSAVPRIARVATDQGAAVQPQPSQPAARPQDRPRLRRNPVSSPVSSPAQSLTDPVEDEESLTSQAASAAWQATKGIGGAALSGLAMIGNLLDLPQSMIRDVLVFDNPLDQLLDPLSHGSTGRSASGRDVLDRNLLTGWAFTPNKETGMSGWVDDPIEGAQDLLGFGAELALGGLTRTPAALMKGTGTAGKTLGSAVGAADSVVDDVADAAKSVVGAADDMPTTAASVGSMGDDAARAAKATADSLPMHLLDEAWDEAHATSRMPGFVSTTDLRATKAFKDVPKEVQDAMIKQARRQGKYSMSLTEGRLPLTDADRAGLYWDGAESFMGIRRRPQQMLDPLMSPDNIVDQGAKAAAQAADEAPMASMAPPAAGPRIPNQVDDPLLHMSSPEAPLSGGTPGLLDRIGATITKYDPGTYVGKAVDKYVVQLADKLNLPTLIDQQVTQKILSTRLGKAVQAKFSPPPTDVAAKTFKVGRKAVSVGLTPQQELQTLIASGSIARGSRILDNLNQDQDLAKRLGEAFGSDVLFWGGAPTRSRARGVRQFNIGNRIWVNADQAADMYNNVVGHEMVHLLRDVDNDAFKAVVELIQKHAPNDDIAVNAKQYMQDFRAAAGRELHPGLVVEEGTARTVQYAFDRPAFWDDLLANPKIEASVHKVFTETMGKLKASGKLTQQEYEVLDRELSTFMFDQRAKMATGATEDSLRNSIKDRFMKSSPANEPLAEALATPGSKPSRVIASVEDLASRIRAGYKAAMVYKVGGHTHPVVQNFAEAKTNLFEAMVTDISLPAISAGETMSRIVDKMNLPDDAARLTAMANIEKEIVYAIEKGDYSRLHPDLHTATKQIELAQSALLQRSLRAGLKLDELQDDYVKYFVHATHPEVQEKLRSLGELAPSHAPSDLATSHKATQSNRTDLFRNAYHGRATWNEATVDPQVLDAIKDISYSTQTEARVQRAADVLRQKYMDTIDPRIPVKREGKYQMLQRMPDGSLGDAMPVSMTEFGAFERAPSPHDLNTPAGRLAEHTQEPIVYLKRSSDANGNEVVTEFELLTGRTDSRYADAGKYLTPDEALDRHGVLAGWLAKVGTDTLEKTGGVFGGSALQNHAMSMQAKVNSLAAAEALPMFMLSGLQAGVIKPVTGDLIKSGKLPRLKEIFGEGYWSSVDRKYAYMKLASLDPSLNAMSKQVKAKEFVKMMDDMTVDEKVIESLKEAGTYMQKLPALQNAVLKPLGSASAIWKAGQLTHPGTHNRNLMSGLAQLMYGNLFSNSAATTAYKALFSQPSSELLHYGAVKNYLDRFGLEHTPENATRAVRVMFGNFMRQSGNIHQDYTDAASPIADAGRGIDALLDPLPGTGRKNPWDAIKGSFKRAIRKEGADETTWNPFDLAGVQHLFSKTDDAGNITAKAGDVRAESTFAPVVGSNEYGKHIDNFTRLTGFIEGLRRGNTPFDAWKDVDFNQINYNPRTFGPLESKVLKKIFPFYSFMSRETAWVAHELLTNPNGRLGKIIRAVRVAQPNNEFLPQHLTEGPNLPIGGEDETGTQNYLTGFGLMFEDPLRMGGNLLAGQASDFARDLVGDSNPLLKAPAEWGLGRSSFQGGPLGGRDLADMDPVLGRIFTQVGLQKEKPGGQAAPAFGSRGLEFMLANSPVSRILSTAKTALDDRKNVLERSMNILTGMRITSVSPEQKQRGIRELTNAIAKDLGSRPFTTWHISNEMLNDAKERDPEKYEKLLAIKEIRKRWDTEQRIKKKQMAAK